MDYILDKGADAPERMLHSMHSQCLTEPWNREIISSIHPRILQMELEAQWLSQSRMVNQFQSQVSHLGLLA